MQYAAVPVLDSHEFSAKRVSPHSITPGQTSQLGETIHWILHILDPKSGTFIFLDRCGAVSVSALMGTAATAVAGIVLVGVTDHRLDLQTGFTDRGQVSVSTSVAIGAIRAIGATSVGAAGLVGSNV